MAGRWIMYDNGSWDFKIDNDRIGRTVDSSGITGVDGLKESISAEYGLSRREISTEICYWLNDGESDMVGTRAAPVEIATDTDFRIFKALHRADKSVNVFVTFRECVAGEMIFLRSERVITSQINAPVRAPDEDEVLLMHVQAFEASLGVNSQSAAMVEKSKDKDKRGEPIEAGCGVNPDTETLPHKKNCEQDKEKVCVEDIAVDNGKNKEANVEEGCRVSSASDKLPQQICREQDKERLCAEKMAVENGNNTEANVEASSEVVEVDRGGNMEDAMGEDEDEDNEYYYNYWDKFVRNDCVTDDDDDFEGGPAKGRSGGQGGVNGNRRFGASGGRGLWSGTVAFGRGGSKSKKASSKRRLSEDITDEASNYISSSRAGVCPYTQGTETDEGVDVVLVTPPKPKNKHNRVTEDDDDFVESPIPESTEYQGGETATKGPGYASHTLPSVRSSHNRETDTGESGDVFLDTPLKQYNIHNGEVEDDDVSVDPPGNSGQEWDDLARGKYVDNPDQGSNVSGGPAIHQPRPSTPTVKSMVRSSPRILTYQRVRVAEELRVTKGYE
ncbi:hypothetical protein Bca4012_084116 [Brassica carinata]